MPDEMMTRTTDSSAVAMGETGGLGNAVSDFIRDAADSGDNSQWAISEQAGQDADQFDTYDDGGDDDNYDDLVNDILGVDTQPQYSEQDAYSEQPNPVPYERFREVNERARQAEEYEAKLQKWGRVIEQFEQQGYSDASQVDAALEQQRQAAEDQAIRNRYQQLVDSQLLDPAVAEAQYEAESARIGYERQMQQVQEYMMYQQREAAFQAYPLAARAEVLVDNLIQAGIDPVSAAQAVHEQVRTLTQAMVPEITSRIKKQQRVPQPMGQGQAARMGPTGGGGQSRPSGLAALLGIQRGRGTL